MKSFAFATIMSMCFLMMSSCASHRPSGTHRTQVERESVVTVTAIDVPKRLVTVRDANGGLMTVYVDPSNKGFPQAGVGDQVRIRYIESIALHVTSQGVGMEIKETTTRPSAGRASGKTSTEVTATVRIDAVSPDGSMVSFTGPRGKRSVQVNDAAMRDYVSKLRPGDHVEVTYEEALALSLEKVHG